MSRRGAEKSVVVVGFVNLERTREKFFLFIRVLILCVSV